MVHLLMSISHLFAQIGCIRTHVEYWPLESNRAIILPTSRNSANGTIHGLHCGSKAQAPHIIDKLYTNNIFLAH